MRPEYLASLLNSYGTDLAAKAYLFSDPFSLPRSLAKGNYLVYDPSFDRRPISELAKEFLWLRDRVAQIHRALRQGVPALVPATQYLNILKSVWPCRTSASRTPRIPRILTTTSSAASATEKSNPIRNPLQYSRGLYLRKLSVSPAGLFLSTIVVS
jgi:hypothetical protein